MPKLTWDEWTAHLGRAAAILGAERPVAGRPVRDGALRELLTHFSRYRLSSEEVEFPDLVAVTYERLYL